MNIISNSTTNRPQRVVVYGAPGVGKTQLAMAFPSPVFLCAEEGLGARAVARFEGTVTSYAQVHDAFTQLYRERHDFKTIVLDSLDWLMPAITAEALTRHGAKSMDDKDAVDYGRGHRWVCEAVGDLLRWANLTAAHRGMHVVIIAHAQAVEARAPQGEKYTAWGLGIPRPSARLVTEWADEIWFVATDVCATAENKKTHERLGYGTSSRIVHVAPNPAWVAKSRALLHEDYECGNDRGYAAILDEFFGRK